ncbi:MAG: glycosyltransferase family 9 protein [Flavobacteriales bacterium]|nr:glycosyltransferase family 9 protein [Flavobacteriales bacterium]
MYIPKEKALIIQNKFIGDVLVSSLIAKNLKKLLHNNVEVHFFCYDKALGILEHNPHIDKIISFDDKKLKQLHELFKMVRYLRSQNYTILIDPYAKLQSRIITLFSKAKVKVSYDKPFFKHFYTHTYKSVLKTKLYDCTAIENRLLLLNPFNKEGKKLDDDTEIFLTSKEINHSKKILSKKNILAKPVIMVGVLGSSKEKSWPLEYMGTLINFLLDKYDFNLLLNYMPSQKDDVCQILSEVDTNNPKLFLKPLAHSIREMAGLLYHCSAFVGNEGGGVNLAKALNIPSFSIYSPHKFRRDWGCFEKQDIHESVHLKDICPDLYRNIYIKDLYRQTELLYPKLRYSYVEDSLRNYLEKIIPTETEKEIND